MLSIAVNAHVSIEIKPFDFFCSSHSFSFQLLLSRLFQCSISSIVIVVVLSYLWFASFFQKHFMNPWRQLFRFFLQDVFFFHHAFCIKIIWNFLLQAMCSHKVSISSNGWMEKNTQTTATHEWRRGRDSEQTWMLLVSWRVLRVACANGIKRLTKRNNHNVCPFEPKMCAPTTRNFHSFLCPLNFHFFFLSLWLRSLSTS